MWSAVFSSNFHLCELTASSIGPTPLQHASGDQFPSWTPTLAFPLYWLSYWEICKTFLFFFLGLVTLDKRVGVEIWPGLSGWVTRQSYGHVLRSHSNNQRGQDPWTQGAWRSHSLCIELLELQVSPCVLNRPSWWTLDKSLTSNQT
jgi:hypothetical protein